MHCVFVLVSVVTSICQGAISHSDMLKPIYKSMKISCSFNSVENDKVKKKLLGTSASASNCTGEIDVFYTDGKLRCDIRIANDKSRNSVSVLRNGEISTLFPFFNDKQGICKLLKKCKHMHDSEFRSYAVDALYLYAFPLDPSIKLFESGYTISKTDINDLRISSKDHQVVRTFCYSGNGALQSSSLYVRGLLVSVFTYEVGADSAISFTMTHYVDKQEISKFKGKFTVIDTIFTDVLTFNQSVADETYVNQQYVTDGFSDYVYFNDGNNYKASKNVGFYRNVQDAVRSRTDLAKRWPTMQHVFLFIILSIPISFGLYKLRSRKASIYKETDYGNAYKG